MPQMPADQFSRRKFVSFLAASPLFAAAGVDFAQLERLFRGTSRDQSRALGLVRQVAQEPELITSVGAASRCFMVGMSVCPPAR